MQLRLVLCTASKASFCAMLARPGAECYNAFDTGCDAMQLQQ